MPAPQDTLSRRNIAKLLYPQIKSHLFLLSFRKLRIHNISHLIFLSQDIKKPQLLIGDTDFLRKKGNIVNFAQNQTNYYEQI